MTRWSEEEDKFILEFIQEVDDEINYSELVKTHNTSFGTKRTEETYKVRLRKIAKENGITLKSKIQWSEEDKTKLIKLVSENPLNIDWSNISKLFNRTELSIRTMYNELVPVDKHIESCMAIISENEINEIMSNLVHNCSNCNKKIYCQPILWNNIEYCEECHYKLYNEKIKERWLSIAEYSCKTGKDKCNICNKNCDFTQPSMCKFNYDHKNMFEKSNTIYSMNKHGINLEDIFNEIDLCQLLCLSCHNIITTIEQKTGFNRIKISLTKEYNKSNDTESKNKIMKQYSDIYDKYMNNIYEIVKRLI
jgi:hypothetical protein